MKPHPVVDLYTLAYRTGVPVAQVRSAGSKLFEQLAGSDSDLVKALIGASSDSELAPEQVLMILNTIAEDFRWPPGPRSKQASEYVAARNERAASFSASPNE